MEGGREEGRRGRAGRARLRLRLRLGLLRRSAAPPAEEVGEPRRRAQQPACEARPGEHACGLASRAAALASRSPRCARRPAALTAASSRRGDSGRRDSGRRRGAQSPEAPRAQPPGARDTEAGLGSLLRPQTSAASPATPQLRFATLRLKTEDSP